MTRINLHVKPSSLTDQHLLAEHREIVRIPNAVKKYGLEHVLSKAHDNFKLGSGHVTYFYDKQLYLVTRYGQIYRECKKRGFNVTNMANAFYGIPKELSRDIEYNSNHKSIVIERLQEKLNAKPGFYKYYGKTL